MSKGKRLSTGVICAAMLFTLAACGPAGPDADRDPDPAFTADGVVWDGEMADLSLDLHALHFDGVAVVQNNGEGKAEDVRIRFGVTSDWETGDGLPDQAVYLSDQKQVEYSLGDLDAGDVLEFDISGLLHQRWDGSDDHVQVVYTLAGTNTSMILGVDLLSQESEE